MRFFCWKDNCMKNTILFGNGLNRLSHNNVSWADILEAIKGKQNFENGGLPNTMIYERAILEEKEVIDERFRTEGATKDYIAKSLSGITTNECYQTLFEVGCSNYITTNYDSSFRKRIMQNLGYREFNNSTESIYSIRRNFSIKTLKGKEICKVWHMHGEVSAPPSIMLGLDHYCGSVAKLDAYVKGTYSYKDNGKVKVVRKLTDKLINNDYDGYSWLELFFNSNIHIVGLSLDYSEIDIWWVLNRRARMLNSASKKYIKNNIKYYSLPLKKEMKDLLKSFKVDVVEHKCDLEEMEWEKYHTKTLKGIK